MGFIKWSHLICRWTFEIGNTDMREGMVVITVVLSNLYNTLVFQSFFF